MFAPRIAFVDLETTGSAPPDSRITEVGIVVVETNVTAEIKPGQERITEWSSLVNPGGPIPPFIQSLTGITNAMVSRAPSFAELAPGLAERLAGAIFIAYNARFDYGFLRAEFARVGIDFKATCLCTVQLSRRLYPERRSHSLDAIIDRFGLVVADRHRALGDARLTLAFVRKLYQRLPPATVDAAVSQLLKSPTLASPLPASAIDELPHAPGVYRFYGASAELAPLYIGHGLDLRQRVAAHFAGGRSSVRDQALAQAIHRLEWETTAGEFGAQLRAAELIKIHRPTHPRPAEAVAIVLDERGRASFAAVSEIAPTLLHQHYGPFTSRSVARTMLIKLAHDQSIGLRELGLEKRSKADPVTASDACETAELLADHAAQVRAALAIWRIPPWPHAGAIALVESAPQRHREDWHVFDHWTHLGSVKTHAAAMELARHAPRIVDADTYRLARRALADEPAWALELVAL